MDKKIKKGGIMNIEKWFERLRAEGNVADKVAFDRQVKYGPDNIGILGAKGLVPRLMDKLMRIKQAIWDGGKQDFNDEKIYDAFLDLRNYAQFGMMLLNNRWYEKGGQSEDQ